MTRKARIASISDLATAKKDKEPTLQVVIRSVPVSVWSDFRDQVWARRTTNAKLLVEAIALLPKVRGGRS